MRREEIGCTCEVHFHADRPKVTIANSTRLAAGYRSEFLLGGEAQALRSTGL